MTVRPLLSPDDLVDLTGRTRPTAQKKWLTRAGIAWRERADGSIVTTWTAVDFALVGAAGRPAGVGPNLGALDR